MPTPEETLNKLRKIETNKTCPNCEEYNSMGFGNVCEPFKTFICNNCKSAHQGYSHRVKSISMSTWTSEEVSALKSKNGGGNKKAKKIWLADYDNAKKHMPKKGDSLDRYKDFINKVYELKKFYSESGDDSDDEEETSSPPPKSKSPTSKSPSKTKKKSDEDLPSSDFDNLRISSVKSTSSGGSNARSSSQDTSSFDFFDAPPVPVAVKSPPPTSTSNDFFSAFDAAPTRGSPSTSFSAAPSNTSSFDMFTSSTTSSINITKPVSDPFAVNLSALGGMPSSPPRPSSSPPIPNPYGMSSSPPMVSSFGYAAPTPVQAPYNLQPPNAFSNPPPSSMYGGVGPYGMTSSYPRGPSPPSYGQTMHMPMIPSHTGSAISNINNLFPVSPPPTSPPHGGRPTSMPSSSNGRDPFASLWESK